MEALSALVFELSGLRLERLVPLASLTTFRIGGPAELVLYPLCHGDIIRALDACRRLDIDVHIMGNGSNILVRDEGIRGLVIVIGEGMSSLEVDGDIFTAGAGMPLSVLTRESLSRGFMGLEWASGIPGTVGGACAMNAGAYGGEIAKRLMSVNYIEVGEEGCELKRASVSPSDMAYRHSIYSAPSRIVVSATFRLEPDDGHALERRSDYLSRRSEKQPLNRPSAGSTFKRPEGHYAGALIEGAGLKGACVGGAMVSEKHAGFIVNTGEATCSDVLALIDMVQSTVMREYGVMLEPEIRIW